MGTAWDRPGDMQTFSGLDGLVQWGEICFAASLQQQRVGLRCNAANCDSPVSHKILNKYFLLPSFGHRGTSLPILGAWWLKEHVQVCESRNYWGSPCECCLHGHGAHPWIKSLSPAPPAPEHRGYWPLKLAKFPVFYIIQSSSAAWTGHPATRSRFNTLLWVHVSASHSCSFPGPWAV